MNKQRKGGLGRGLNSLIGGTEKKPISRPSDVFFPETQPSAEKDETKPSRPRGGSARDLLLPGGGKQTTKRKTRSPKAKPAAENSEFVPSASKAGDGIWGIIDENVSRETSDGPQLAPAKKRANVSRETPAPQSPKLASAQDDFVAAAEAAGVTATYAEIFIDSIHPNAKQPRTVFDEEDLDELANSVREVGVLQPIVVRPDGDTFELIMGERRWRASKQAGLETIPAIIRWTGDNEMLRDALLENLHRAQLNPLEEAAAYQQLMQEFGCSQTELAQRIARSRPVITNTLRLLQLPPKVQTRVAAQVLSAGHARALLGLDTPEDMEFLADRIVSEGLSVRSTEELVALGDVRGSHRPRPRTQPGRVERGELPAERAAAERIAELLDTQVKVTLGAKRGRIVIEFADQDDLERIITALKG